MFFSKLLLFGVNEWWMYEWLWMCLWMWIWISHSRYCLHSPIYAFALSILSSSFSNAAMNVLLYFMFVSATTYESINIEIIWNELRIVSKLTVPQIAIGFIARTRKRIYTNDEKNKTGCDSIFLCSVFLAWFSVFHALCHFLYIGWLWVVCVNCDY